MIRLFFIGLFICLILIIIYTEIWYNWQLTFILVCTFLIVSFVIDTWYIKSINDEKLEITEACERGCVWGYESMLGKSENYNIILCIFRCNDVYYYESRPDN